MAIEMLTVCLPPTDVPAVHGAVDRAMAPFDMNGAAGSWQGEWDSWGIGGRSPFAVRPGAEYDPRLIRVEHLPGPSAPPPLPPSLCDGGPRGLLDLDTERDTVAGRAREEWRTWHEYASSFPPARTMDDFRKEFNELYGMGPDARFRGLFEEQEVIRAIPGNPRVLALTTDTDDPVARFSGSEGGHVLQASTQVNTTDALLTLDGRWLDVSTDAWRDQSENHGKGYFGFADAYLLGLPGDCLLIRVRFRC